MIHLPTDVLLLIFSLLTQRDKLECMTVCQQWNVVIYNRSLFRVINIYQVNKLEQLMQIVEMDPTLGAKVEQLHLQLELNLSCDEMTIVERFPNLRHFAIINTNDSFYSDNHYIISRKSHPWCKHIETMLENDSDLRTKALLQLGLCPNLTFISVIGQYKESVCGFIEALSNAPALKTLHLDLYEMSFQDFELLHLNVPFLNTLRLSFITLDSKPSPRDIMPATSLKTFQLILCGLNLLYKFNPHLPYIIQKYTCLEELDVQLNPPGNTPHGNYDDLVLQHKAMIRSYMKILAPQLKSLSLTIPAFEQTHYTAFDDNLLDECGCQIKTLNFKHVIKVHMLDHLAKTGQVQFIQSLTIRIDIDDDDDQSRLMECIRYFTILKELNLSLVDHDHVNKVRELNMTDLLDALRDIQLKTLVLTHLELKFDKTRTIQIHPFLKHLTCSSVILGVGTDVFVTEAFPNLKHLTLDHCFVGNKILMLTNTSLLYLKIVAALEDQALQTLIVTLADDKKRLYTASRKPVSAKPDVDMVDWRIEYLPSISSEPYTGLSAAPWLTITCKSVYNVFLLNGDL